MSDTATNVPPRLTRLTRLTFHGPLSEARAARLVERVSPGIGTVLDIGCGWGELLLRVLEAAPGATGTGVDLNGDDLARGRATAEKRGLADRVTFAPHPRGALRRARGGGLRRDAGRPRRERRHERHRPRV
ncbi:methyltransferase domain-containing protein [Streptomyces sp. MZ04]|nr:methyltransferase domain-containing protein [Streptomyces sp. MZ04]